MSIPGLTCRWDKAPDWCVSLWNDYVKVHKRGGLGLEHCPPIFLDCIEAELHAEAARARREREKKASQDYLKSQVY